MNVDNFIRSRPSVRVHEQPGGNSSLASVIYGGGGGSDAASKERSTADANNKAAPTAAAGGGSGAGLRDHLGEVHRTTLFVVSADARTELTSMCKRLRMKTKKERSCKHFVLLEDANSCDTIIVQEAYENYNAFCLHERQDHAVDFKESLTNMGDRVKTQGNTMKLLG